MARSGAGPTPPLATTMRIASALGRLGGRRFRYRRDQGGQRSAPLLPPPGPAATMAAKPTYVQTVVVSSDKLSLGEGSGWRARSTSRVAQLREVFLAGQFGQSCACGVQILAKEDVDGAHLIDDGVSTVAALKQLQKERAERAPADDPDDLAVVVEDPQILAIFAGGLQVTVVKY